MSANDLLLWMSARASGSWRQFRAAVENLHLAGTAGDNDDTAGEGSTERASTLPAYQLLRLNLERLGHAEFFDAAGDAGWRVAPAALAASYSKSGALAFLAGARSDKLMAKLRSVEHEGQIETRSMPACPDQISIRAQDAQGLKILAKKTGLMVQDNTPAAILSCLPPIDALAWDQPADFPFGADWKIERFSVSGLGWTQAGFQHAHASPGGVFSFTHGYQNHVLYCRRGSVTRVSRQVGIYRTLTRRRAKVIRYDRGSADFFVPGSCRPPLLIERALVLCSGTLPIYERGEKRSGTLRYSDIPLPIARMAARLLRQDIR